MNIGILTMDEIKNQVTRHLDQYATALREVYSDLEEEHAMTVSFSVKIAPKKGKNEVKTAISFVTGRVKDEITTQVNEGQLGLFNGGSGKIDWDVPCPDCGGVKEHFSGCRIVLDHRG